jgi:hypothetical protein
LFARKFNRNFVLLILINVIELAGIIRVRTLVFQIKRCRLKLKLRIGVGMVVDVWKAVITMLEASSSLSLGCSILVIDWVVVPIVILGTRKNGPVDVSSHASVFT